MNKILRLSVLLILAVATHATAAFESAKFAADNCAPQFPLRLVLDGVSEGHVIILVSIGADGKLGDSLPLEYTHLPLVKACQEAMKVWIVAPARFDGENVPVQLQLRFDFKREGFVETNSINIVNHFLEAGFSGREARRLEFRVARPQELDRVPVLMTTVAPEYAKQAEQQGVRGKVQVAFYIDEKGEVRLPSVTVEAHPYLSDIAVTALRHWRFEPPTSRGRPVLVAASQEFNFGAAK